MLNEHDLEDMRPTPAQPYCKVCEGAGTISTGVAEASSTQCRFCDGTGYSAALRANPEG